MGRTVGQAPQGTTPQPDADESGIADLCAAGAGSLRRPAKLRQNRAGRDGGRCRLRQKNRSRSGGRFTQSGTAVYPRVVVRTGARNLGGIASRHTRQSSAHGRGRVAGHLHRLRTLPQRNPAGPGNRQSHGRSDRGENADDRYRKLRPGQVRDRRSLKTFAPRRLGATEKNKGKKQNLKCRGSRGNGGFLGCNADRALSWSTNTPPSQRNIRSTL